MSKLPYPDWFGGERRFDFVSQRRETGSALLKIYRDDLTSRLRNDSTSSSEMVNALLCLPSDDIIKSINWYRDAALFDQLTLAYASLPLGQLPPDGWLCG